MHGVIAAHLADFVKMHGVEASSSKSFESFVNYVILRIYSADPAAAADLVYEGDDPGIDGIMFVVDDRLVSSAEEVDEAFSGKRRDLEATIIFTQVKSSESWDKGEINIFQSAVVDFLRERPHYPHSDYIRNASEVLAAIIRNVGKLKGGKPVAACYFAMSGQPVRDREIQAAFDVLKTDVEAVGLFREVSVVAADRDAIVQYWDQANGPVEATLPVIAMAAFPKVPGVEEGYVVTCRAADFVTKILSDAQGKLRQAIFEENVRDFIGSDGEVNTEMVETLSDEVRQKRFGILNNGVTLISPDVRVQGNEIYLRDFQIVNGCQTSNILFADRLKLTPDVPLMLKVVETSEASLVDEIVRSTNRQAKVEDDQFLATLNAVKGIEDYFSARGRDEEYELYFERRANQFAGDEIPPARIFDIKRVARAAGSMWFDRPEFASRYPNRLTGELRDVVFKKEYAEHIYYTAAFALYRLLILIGNKRIDPKYGKLRWHILMAMRYYFDPSATNPESRKVQRICTSLDKFIASGEAETIETLGKITAAVGNADAVTRDQLRSAAFVREVKAAAIELGKART